MKTLQRNRHLDRSHAALPRGEAERPPYFALVLVVVLVTSASSLCAQSAESRGYHLRDYHWDPVLAQNWAVLEDAAHPERPLLAELAPPGMSPKPAPATSAAAPVPPPLKPLPLAVHSGDAVTLWSNEKNLRMQLAAVAEGNAAVGERIQLRVTGAGVYGNTGWRVAGIVRGPGSVEMEQ
jgi:hypothetical protein